MNQRLKQLSAACLNHLSKRNAAELRSAAVYATGVAHPSSSGRFGAMDD